MLDQGRQQFRAAVDVVVTVEVPHVHVDGVLRKPEFRGGLLFAATGQEQVEGLAHARGDRRAVHGVPRQFVLIDRQELGVQEVEEGRLAGPEGFRRPPPPVKPQEEGCAVAGEAVDRMDAFVHSQLPEDPGVSRRVSGVVRGDLPAREGDDGLAPAHGGGHRPSVR